MKGTTHLLFGLLLATLITTYFSFETPLLAILLVLLGSLLPDIDEKTSLLGRKVPLVGMISTHRGFFHGILFLVICIAALNVFVSFEYVLAFSAGFVSHLILDAMTPKGVKPFWPSEVKISGFVRVGGLLEKAIVVCVSAAFVYLLVA